MLCVHKTMLKIAKARQILGWRVIFGSSWTVSFVLCFASSFRQREHVLYGSSGAIELWATMLGLKHKTKIGIPVGPLKRREWWAPCVFILYMMILGGHSLCPVCSWVICIVKDAKFKSLKGSVAHMHTGLGKRKQDKCQKASKILEVTNRVSDKTCLCYRSWSLVAWTLN